MSFFFIQNVFAVSREPVFFFLHLPAHDVVFIFFLKKREKKSRRKVTKQDGVFKTYQ